MPRDDGRRVPPGEDIMRNMITTLRRFERTVICHPDQHTELAAAVAADPAMRHVTVLADDLVPAGTAYVMPTHPELFS
jgi:hypothetical protein